MITRNRAEEAAEFMDVSLDNLSYGALKVAYHTNAKVRHPDTTEGSIDAWRTLKKANEDLAEWLRQNKHVEGACEDCGGTGRLAGKPVRWCKACMGRGMVA
jgi:DnaJ-class molecular chaperone